MRESISGMRGSSRVQRPLRVKARYSRLLDGDFRAALSGFAEGLDAVINHRANPLEELDAGICEVFSNVFRDAKRLAELVQDLPAQAALLTGAFACLLPRCFLCAHCASFISTVSSRFSSFAPAGTSVAIDRGKPMWRRSVPTSTTSSSPFLNSPISPFVVNGNRSRTSYLPFRFPNAYGFSVIVTAAGSSRSEYNTFARSRSRRFPSTSWANRGTRLTGTGAKYSSSSRSTFSCELCHSLNHVSLISWGSTRFTITVSIVNPCSEK